ncbi:hypothetical protein OB2597_03869 [Pseudooceanicola batsensis HTCC2597]|uniref:MobA-like NTP transferase domain-containing protein n=1 Tax=Pseudooceanicola batsensis (strain ATCC BAA-863 / DSM 15984 / KCTC 12145 / HTCC2597) TaxID=252305 RepID=A3U3V7_PSEBH|nr:nucleotidyltransferase family protein [Pseudooceanicola batsensis]EAQ01196.1 hypothetical protein OB2597_03869 [Pseudooceanicola batsensis HTCC2597]
MELAILLLAAGASARMRGRDKLMEPVEGAPLVATMARRARAVTPHVVVTLPDLAHPRARALEGQPLRLLSVPDAATGMSASFRAAAAALPAEIPGLLILPADMPDLTADDLATVAARWRSAPDRIHRATAADGTPGHPVVLPARLLPALKGLTGDTGPRTLLRPETVVPVRLPARNATTDLDTPEDWAAWRARP